MFQGTFIVEDGWMCYSDYLIIFNLILFKSTGWLRFNNLAFSGPTMTFNIGSKSDAYLHIGPVVTYRIFSDPPGYMPSIGAANLEGLCPKIPLKKAGILM